MICGASVVSMIVSSATLHNLILGHCRILLAQVGQWLPRPSWNCVVYGVTGDEMMIIHCDDYYYYEMMIIINNNNNNNNDGGGGC